MKKKLLFGVNDDWNMCMMYYVVVDIVYKCMFKNIYVFIFYYYNISFIFFDCFYDGFIRFSII